MAFNLRGLTPRLYQPKKLKYVNLRSRSDVQKLNVEKTDQFSLYSNVHMGVPNSISTVSDLDPMKRKLSTRLSVYISLGSNGHFFHLIALPSKTI